MRILVALLVLLLAPGAGATEWPPLDGAAARRILENEGTLAFAEVNGDLDLSGLRPPAEGALLLQHVRLKGSLRGAPDGRLEIAQSIIGAWRVPPGVLFRYAVDIDNTIFEGRVGFERAYFKERFACHRCRFNGNLVALDVRFEAGADFAFSVFAFLADFSAARFGTAAFDKVLFLDSAEARFEEVDFIGVASFAGMDARGAPISFRGTAFRDAAVFRGCRLGYAAFGPTKQDAPDSPFRNAIASFDRLLDLRRCRFANIDLREASLQGGARFEGAVLEGGMLDLRGITVGDEVMLRAFRLVSGAKIALDEAAALGIVADAKLLQAESFSEADATTFDALARRAQALGLPTEGRRLAHTATGLRAEAGDNWSAQAEWALQWLTRNGTELTRPLCIGAALWLLAFLAAQPRGVLVAVPLKPDNAALGLLSRVLAPIHQPPPPKTVGQWCAATPKGRITAAASYAFALVFKVGPREWLPQSSGWRTAIFATLWYVGFGVAAIIVSTAIALVPGLRELRDALPG